MIDMHSHFLPGMDDGSASPEESARMLRLSKEQGVDTIVATSHFYAHRDNPAEYLQRREEALEKLEYDPATMPEIILGAEVSYFNGMSRSEDLHKLCFGTSRLLLVEMPFRPWTSTEVADVCALLRQGILPVLAHVERYPKKGQFPTYAAMMLQDGVCVQCNAEFFLQPFSGMRAVSMLRKGQIHFIGSDCHNMAHRISKIDQAAQVIRRRLGQEALDRLDAIARELLSLERN